MADLYPDNWRDYYETRAAEDANRSALQQAEALFGPPDEQVPVSKLIEAAEVASRPGRVEGGPLEAPPPPYDEGGWPRDPAARAASLKALKGSASTPSQAAARELTVPPLPDGPSPSEIDLDGYPPAHWTSALEEESLEPDSGVIAIPPGEQVSDEQEVANLVAQEGPPDTTDPLGTERQEYVEQNPTEESVLQGAIDLEADKAEYTASRALEEMDKADVALIKANKVREQRDANIRTRIQALHTDAEQAANAKVDPARWWNNASTGQRIASVLAAAIGGWLSPLQGGKNSALDAIDKAIDRDIEAQMADLQNMRYGITERRGIIGDLAKQSQDEFRAAEATWQAAYQTMDKRLAAEQAKYDPKGTRFQAVQAMRLGIMQRAQARAAAYADKVAQDEFRRAQLEIQAFDAETRRMKEDKRGAGGGSALGRPGKWKSPLNPHEVAFVIGPGGQKLYASTPENGTMLSKLTSNATQAAYIFNDLIEMQPDQGLTDKINWKIWKPEKHQRMQQAISDLISIYRRPEFTNSGASFTENEEKILKGSIGEANTFADLRVTWKAALERLRNKVETDVGALTADESGQRVRPTWVPPKRQSKSFKEGGVPSGESLEMQTRRAKVEKEEAEIKRRQTQMDVEEAARRGSAGSE